MYRNKSYTQYAMRSRSTQNNFTIITTRKKFQTKTARNALSRGRDSSLVTSTPDYSAIPGWRTRCVVSLCNIFCKSKRRRRRRKDNTPFGKSSPSSAASQHEWLSPCRPACQTGRAWSMPEFCAAEESGLQYGPTRRWREKVPEVAPRATLPSSSCLAVRPLRRRG